MIRQGLNNTQGLLGAGEALAVSSQGELNNRGGTVQGMGKPAWRRGTYATKPANCWAGNGSLSLRRGAWQPRGEISGESLTLTAQRLDNAQGKVVARQDANLTAQQGLNNAAGWLEAGKALTVKSAGDWDNRGGTAQGGRQVTATAQTLDNTGGRLQSGGDLGLDTSGNILNRSGKLTSSRRSISGAAIPACLTTTAAHCKAAAICLCREAS